jgi:hypothetical protein
MTQPLPSVRSRPFRVDETEATAEQRQEEDDLPEQGNPGLEEGPGLFGVVGVG